MMAGLLDNALPDYELAAGFVAADFVAAGFFATGFLAAGFLTAAGFGAVVAVFGAAGFAVGFVAGFLGAGSALFLLL